MDKRAALDRVRTQAESCAAAREWAASLDAILRRKIVQARDAGATVQEVADVLGKSRPWVYAFMAGTHQKVRTQGAPESQDPGE